MSDLPTPRISDLARVDAAPSYLEGLNPEDYPDIHKLRILSDVAPYSREYKTRSLRPVPTKKPRARVAGPEFCSRSRSAPHLQLALLLYA